MWTIIHSQYINTLQLHNQHSRSYRQLTLASQLKPQNSLFKNVIVTARCIASILVEFWCWDTLERPLCPARCRPGNKSVWGGALRRGGSFSSIFYLWLRLYDLYDTTAWSRLPTSNAACFCVRLKFLAAHSCPDGGGVSNRRLYSFNYTIQWWWWWLQTRLNFTGWTFLVAFWFYLGLYCVCTSATLKMRILKVLDQVNQ